LSIEKNVAIGGKIAMRSDESHVFKDPLLPLGAFLYA
jgi:hypothetical protein